MLCPASAWIAACHLGLSTLIVMLLGDISAATDVDRYGDPLPPGAVARLGTIRLGHSSVIHHVAFSPDGKTLASEAGAIYLWDAATGQMIRRLRVLDETPQAGEPDWVRRAILPETRAISPDGKVVAMAGRDGVILFRDLATWKELRTLDNPGRTTYLAYAPEGKTLISTSWSERGKGECRLWDLEMGKVLRRWSDVGKPTALSPDGKSLLTGTADFRLQLWDVETGKELSQFKLPRENDTVSVPAEAAWCVAFSPDGKLLAAGDMTNRVHVWDVGTGKELHCSPPFRNWVTCLTFSPNSKKLAVGNWHRIRIWDAATGKDLLPFGGHTNQVGRVAFSPDGKTIVTQSSIFGNEMILWDPLTGRERQKWSDKHFVAFAPNGDLLLSDKGAIVQWQPATGKTLRTFKVYERSWPEDVSTISVVFSRDGKLMLSGSQDRTIRMWNFERGKELWRAKRTNKDRRFPADIGGHWPLGFINSGKAVVTSADDAVIRIYDAITGKELRWLRIDSSEAALSPDGRFIVAVGEHVAAPDSSSETRGAAPPRMWDLTEQGEPKPTKLYPKSAGSPAFSPDGKVVAVSDGAEIVLLERATGKEFRRLKGHTDHVLNLAFSPDGKTLVSGSYDLTALVWEVR